MADEARELVPLHDLGGGDVSGGDTDVRGFDAVLRSGRKAGTARELLYDREARRAAAVALDLPGGFRSAHLPLDQVEIDPSSRRVVVNDSAASLLGISDDDDDRTVILDPRATADAGTAAGAMGDAAARPAAMAAAGDEERRLTLAEEELALYKERVAAGSVDIHKHVETRHVREAVPVMRDEVTIERRAIAEGGEPRMEQYTEGDELHIPLVEEVLVVEKRRVVREELVIRKTQVQREEIVEADLRRERADVQRTGEAADGEARDEMR